MRVEKTNLDGVLLVTLDVFKDHRGEYVETYNKKLYADNGIDVEFVQDDISVSSKNVLRGIHGDGRTWKLISCPYGKIYFVVVVCNPASRQFGQWQSFILSEENRQQVLVPPKFGNAHLVLSDKAIFQYKQTSYYDPGSQFSCKWNDPRFKITWPVSEPILSKRDG
ncbi:MAG: dTDP-4-dehydrorhamnose 3,5-epimerase family protein [Candidatus Omnitrophota bacterium]